MSGLFVHQVGATAQIPVTWKGGPSLAKVGPAGSPGRVEGSGEVIHTMQDGTGRPERGRIPRWQKAIPLVPLALLAGAWTASLGSPNTATADAPIQDPGVPAVPATSFDQPASYTQPKSVDPDDNGLAPTVKRDPANPSRPSSESVNGIPAAAMAAYRTAEAVLAKADASCHISWALIAAIGRVESDHGRYGGNVLGMDGKTEPGIFGIPLDGTNNTALITDSDGGKYDNDTTYDRAVGPMQFIPGTWEIVGVDGDADGVRDPQDIDDAALAAAVYLCAGEQNLSTPEGQRSAVFSYNHSDEYVDLVLSIMAAYLDGDFTTVADGLPNNEFIPATKPSDKPAKPGRDKPRKPANQPGNNNPGSPGSDPPTGNGGNPNTPNNPDDSDPPDQPDNPNPDPPDGQNPDNPAPNVPDPDPVVQRLETLAEATQYCAANLPGSPTQPMIRGCGQRLVGETNAAAAQLLSGTLPQVLARLGLDGLIPPVDVPCVPLPGIPCD